MHGKGNFVVSYKGEITNVHKYAIYVWGVEEFVIFWVYNRYGLWGHVWNTWMLNLAKGRRNYLNEFYKFVITSFPQRSLQFSQNQQLKQILPQLPLIKMLFMDL